MRIFKIKIPSETLLELELPDYFKVIKHMEILQIYEYDRNNFFAMSKILFKRDKIDELDKHLRSLFFAQSYQILERKSNEILCILKQRNDSGFWPALLSDSFALIPPLIIGSENITCSIIAKDDKQLNAVLDQLETFKSMQVFSVSKIDELDTSSMKIMPRLTNRQRDIMTYATQNGYFKIPKQISTKKISEHFQISSSAILNHIQKAERIIMDYFFG